MLKIIAALAANAIIGKNRDLPFKLSDDLKRFKEITTHHPVAMGRKTFFSLPQEFRPLPGRENIVLSRAWKDRIYGVTHTAHFEEIVSRSETEDIFVIGGAMIYSLALPFASMLYLTRVHADVDGDVSFPEWNPSYWEIVSSEFHPKDPKNEHAFTWEVWKRRVTS